MDEKQVRKIVQDEMNRQKYQSGKPNILVHDHDGNNSPRINGANIVHNTKFVAFIKATEGTPQENTLIIGGTAIPLAILNPSSVSFHGIAFSPASGTVVYKASITGEAQFGNTIQLNTGSSGTSSALPKQNIVQGNSSTFFDGSTTFVDKNSVTHVYWQPTVDSDNINLAAAYDNSANSVGYIQVTAFTNTSITLQAYIKSGWVMEGTIIIT